MKDNGVEKYSIHCEEKSASERFIGALKKYKYMTKISKNVYFDQLADIVNEYNHTICWNKWNNWSLLM